MANRVGWAAQSASVGRPFMIGVHVAPLSVLLYIALPRKDEYMTFGVTGSMRSSVAPSEPVGAPFSRCQLTPPSVDSQIPYGERMVGVVRCAPPRPRMIAAYTWFSLLGSIARRAVETP